MLDRRNEAELDRLVRLAEEVFRVPAAALSLVGADRPLVKADAGVIGPREIERVVSLCADGLGGDGLLVVPDAQVEPPSEADPPGPGAPVRFYAGTALVTAAGDRIGTFCVMDVAPRPALDERERSMLRRFACIALDHMEMRRPSVLWRAACRMADATPDSIICSDAMGRITFWNAAAVRTFGFSRQEAIGQPLAMIVPPEFRDAHAAGMGRLHAGGEPRLAGKIVEMAGIRKDGTRFPLELSLAVWRDGEALQVGSIIRDVSERHRVEERLRFLMHFDRLTGLPNRVSFLAEIEGALRGVCRFSVLKIGFDDFKAVNGSMGSAAGDAILQTAAERVAGVAMPGEIVARLGADEFGLLRLEADSPVEADSRAASLLAILTTPYAVGVSRCHLGASIGIVLCPGRGHFDDADAVLKAALLALQSAKAAGGRRAAVFSPWLGQQADERHRLEEELREALETGAFELHYQPQVRLCDRKVVGAEALLRWRHPVRGLLAPAVFLSVLESSAMAPALGHWILETSCAVAAALAAAGTPVRMGVNLFPGQLLDAALVDRVMGTLHAAALPAELLELEITERTMLGLEDDVVAHLRRLRAAGVKLAFDDYGTGYASLSLLKRYPVTRLKIDREFVRDLDRDAGDAAIVRAVLALGASLNMEVIAEGIETPEQAALLAGLGCLEGQGYLFGRPMSEAAFRKLLGRGSQEPDRAVA